MEYQLRELEEECKPSVDMGTSTNDFFDPQDYYPLQYSNMEEQPVDWTVLLNSPQRYHK